MGSERLTALTDGVVAVILTIMVLEMHPPHGATLKELAALWPVFLSYVLSFVYVAIYWNNHHHFFKLVPRIDGLVMWANLNLLFWLSLIPFTTAWMGEHELEPVPTALYGLVLVACGLAWWAMQRAIIRLQHGAQASPLRRAMGRDLKGLASPPLYLAAVGLAFVAPIASDLIYAGVAVMWLLPDRRVERAIAAGDAGD